MSRERRINQTSKKPIDVQAAMQIVEAAEREANERSQRCQERVAAVLAEENCEMVAQGQFRGNQIVVEVLFSPKPVEPTKAE